MNANGVLSFRSSFSEHNARRLPLQNRDDIFIAPFWSDINIVRAGAIFYRTSHDTSLLSQVASYINVDESFFPAALFIATWDGVAEFSGDIAVVQRACHVFVILKFVET